METTIKILKRSLLGGPAGLLAWSGAQGADLPPKTEPVDYVRICPAYGAGFYSIPGTDICLRVGGHVRVEYSHNARGANPSIDGAQGRNNRDKDTHPFRARSRLILDARTNTAYGTLRSYLTVGATWITSDAGASESVWASRAFIQFAGFTFGRTQSFFDFWGRNDVASLTSYNESTTNASGWNVLAYTAEFDNGLSATLSLEDQRKRPILDLGSAGDFVAGASLAPNRRAGTRVPAIVGNFRIDQAWGSAQVMGALQEVRGQYTEGSSTSITPATETKWGYAIGGGFTLNNPSAPGSHFGIQATLARGATGYVVTSYTQHGIFETNESASIGWLTDAVYGVGTDPGSLHLTRAWGFYAGYEHVWNPQWRTSIHGGYTKIDYRDDLDGFFFCGPGSAPGCSNSYSFWSLGTRIRWMPVANLNIGLDALYHRFESQFGVPYLIAQSGTRPAGLIETSSQNVWSSMLRVQRNF